MYFTNVLTGKYTRITTRTKSKPEATKFLSDFQNNLKEKKFIKDTTVLYLSDLKTEVLKYVDDNLEKSTANLYRTVFLHLDRIIGSKALRLINNADIENYKNVRSGEVRKATVNKDLNTLKAIFNIAIKFDWIKTNPVNKVRKLSIPQKEYLCFDITQIKLILNNIENVNIKHFIMFALLTGCRLNEIINLQIKDINFQDKLITIRNKANFKTKTGKIRDIPISDNLFNLLNEIVNVRSNGNILNFYNPDQYLFTNSQKYKFTKDYITHYFKKVLRKLNFDEKYHFHCLRHTFITTLIKAGVNINYVKEIAGHSEIGTTMNYIHISTNDLRDAVNKINLFI